MVKVLTPNKLSTQMSEKSHSVMKRKSTVTDSYVDAASEQPKMSKLEAIADNEKELEEEVDHERLYQNISVCSEGKLNINPFRLQFIKSIKNVTIQPSVIWLCSVND